MSVLKLLSRIVESTKGNASPLSQGRGSGKGNEGNEVQSHAYGITDPLTQFACAFAAVIHDVDHMGVPNMQLVKEQSALAIQYKNKSVAEQNSFDMSWQLLMEDQFSDLRSAIYGTEDEFVRFRQLVVNSVMATDVSNLRKIHELSINSLILVSQSFPFCWFNTDYG